MAIWTTSDFPDATERLKNPSVIIYGDISGNGLGRDCIVSENSDDMDDEEILLDNVNIE